VVVVVGFGLVVARCRRRDPPSLSLSLSQVMAMGRSVGLVSGPRVRFVAERLLLGGGNSFRWMGYFVRVVGRCRRRWCRYLSLY